MEGKLSGARIPIGVEPELCDHIQVECKFHKYFVSGIGDIFRFDDTWNNTPEALLDIIKGAFAQGMRYFTGYNADNDVVRVTGYLVKKSEIEKLDHHEASLNNVTVFGQGARNTAKALDRRIYDESSVNKIIPFSNVDGPGESLCHLFSKAVLFPVCTAIIQKRSICAEVVENVLKHVL